MNKSKLIAIGAGVGIVAATLASSLSVHITFDNVMKCLEILAMIGIIVYAIEFFPLVGTLIGFSLYVYPEDFK